MEENRDYHAYRYGDHLTPGSELKIEHSVVCENVDISTLITMGIDISILFIYYDCIYNRMCEI